MTVDRQTANSHHLARHLRAIARIITPSDDLPVPLTAAASAILWIGAPFTPEALERFASRLEASAPFVPLTDEEKAELFGEIVDEVSDYSAKENAETVCGDWTEADWRMERDDRDEYMKEDE